MFLVFNTVVSAHVATAVLLGEVTPCPSCGAWRFYSARIDPSSSILRARSALWRDTRSLTQVSNIVTHKKKIYKLKICVNYGKIWHREQLHEFCVEQIDTQISMLPIPNASVLGTILILKGRYLICTNLGVNIYIFFNHSIKLLHLLQMEKSVF